MKRMDYETLAMEEIIVEMENGFLEGSAEVRNPVFENEGGIKAHDVNTGFGESGTVDFSNGTWKNNPF